MKKSKRYSLTLRESYANALDKLVERGVYYEPQEVIREALRAMFDRYGIAPFKIDEAED